MSHVTHINESSESKSRVECSGRREQESERVREQESKRASGVMSVATCNSKPHGWWHDAREYESCHTYD